MRVRNARVDQTFPPKFRERRHAVDNPGSVEVFRYAFQYASSGVAHRFILASDPQFLEDLRQSLLKIGRASCRERV